MHAVMAPPEAVRPAVGTFKQAESRVEARLAEESVQTGVCKRVGKTCSKTCAVGDLTARVDVGSHGPRLAVLSCHVAAMQKAQGGPANVHRHGGVPHLLHEAELIGRALRHEDDDRRQRHDLSTLGVAPMARARSSWP